MKPFNNEDSKRLELVTRLYHEKIPLDKLENFLNQSIQEKRKKEFGQRVVAEALNS